MHLPAHLPGAVRVYWQGSGPHYVHYSHLRDKLSTSVFLLQNYTWTKCIVQFWMRNVEFRNSIKAKLNQRDPSSILNEKFGVQKFTPGQIKSKGPLLPTVISMPLDQASPSPDNTFLCFRLCLDRFLKPSVSYLCGTLPEFFSSVCGLCQRRHLFLPQQQPNEVHWTWIKSNFKIFHSLEEVFRSKYFIKMT